MCYWVQCVKGDYLVEYEFAAIDVLKTNFKLLDVRSKYAVTVVVK